MLPLLAVSTTGSKPSPRRVQTPFELTLSGLLQTTGLIAYLRVAYDYALNAYDHLIASNDPDDYLPVGGMGISYDEETLHLREEAPNNLFDLIHFFYNTPRCLKRRSSAFPRPVAAGGGRHRRRRRAIGEHDDWRSRCWLEAASMARPWRVHGVSRTAVPEGGLWAYLAEGGTGGRAFVNVLYVNGEHNRLLRNARPFISYYVPDCLHSSYLRNAIDEKARPPVHRSARPRRAFDRAPGRRGRRTPVDPAIRRHAARDAAGVDAGGAARGGGQPSRASAAMGVVQKFSGLHWRDPPTPPAPGHFSAQRWRLRQYDAPKTQSPSPLKACPHRARCLRSRCQRRMRGIDAIVESSINERIKERVLSLVVKPPSGSLAFGHGHLRRN